VGRTSSLVTPVLVLLFGLAGLVLMTAALPADRLAGQPGTRRHMVAYSLDAHRAGAITLGLAALAIAGIVHLLHAPVP